VRKVDGNLRVPVGISIIISSPSHYSDIAAAKEEEDYYDDNAEGDME